MRAFGFFGQPKEEAEQADFERERRCPRCGSPDPKRHPAMQFEGEVQICPDPWHRAALARKEGP